MISLQSLEKIIADLFFSKINKNFYDSDSVIYKSNGFTPISAWPLLRMINWACIGVVMFTNRQNSAARKKFFFIVLKF